MKTCSICKEVKPLDEFRRNRNHKDGHQTQCKPCSNARLDIWRARTREHRLAYNREYYRSERGKSVIRSYQERTPAQAWAQAQVWYAIAKGALTKSVSCELCGSGGRIDGHHDDYAKPLIVRWLCRLCHKSWHRQNGRAANIDMPIQKNPIWISV